MRRVTVYQRPNAGLGVDLGLYLQVPQADQMAMLSLLSPTGCSRYGARESIHLVGLVCLVALETIYR